MADNILRTIYVVIGPEEKLISAHNNKPDADYYANDLCIERNGEYVVRQFILPASEDPTYIRRQDQCVCPDDKPRSGKHCIIHDNHNYET
jgi:hypothetical protein